uniref:Uncharacterized protein n=1 Tax=Talaromyces marneffei PM1 TaxID=1077442 RepID=A0A093UXH7_TALMA
MAPLPLPESRFTSPPPPPSVKTATAAAVNQLGRLRVLVYIFLGTSAAFGLGFLVWKLGSLFRQFTLGRILSERKLAETRYIKTWYGWIPQDRYDIRKQKWKGLYSNFKDWFSWEDSDDYNKIWWDSDHGGDQTRCKRKLGSVRARLRRASIIRRKSQHIVVSPVTRAPTAASTYHLPHRSSSAYLTYPLCLKPTNPVVSIDNHPGLLTPRVASAFQRRLGGQTSLESQISMGKPITSSMIRQTRQLRYLQEWATRLEMGSLQSILPHQVGILGRPGSPLLRLHSSSGSSQQTDSCEILLPETLPLLSFAPTNSQLVHTSASDPGDNMHSISEQNHLKPHRCLSRICLSNKQSEALDVEWRFVDTVDRHLEWLANECQPGQRGFRFPVLPKNWINNGKRLVYTNPCGASVEYMRQYAQCDVRADDYEQIDQRKSSTAVSHRRVRAKSIESWRAAINRERRHHDMTGVRSVEIFMSSAEDVTDTVIDPANWILRRPPQGFEMPSRQKTANWYGGIGRWAKLEEWQVVGGINDDPADVRKKRMDVFASSEREFWRNHAEIVCS